MSASYPVCPKCGYQRNEYDKLVHAGVCPACGIVYVKWLAAENNADSLVDDDQEREDEPPLMSVYESLKDLFLSVPDQVDTIVFYGRLLLFCALFLWGWSFILGGIDWQSIGGSFLHNINLPFHEFGHVLFMPFGRFWHILGGSLFQILLPLLILLGFSIKQRDNFGGSVMLWWAGQNFIDVSPYIADAQLRALPLIRGLGEDCHDWGNLLVMTGNLQHTHNIATLSFTLGCLLILTSNVWGAYLLMQQRKITE
jgi:hypothetical protein